MESSNDCEKMFPLYLACYVGTIEHTQSFEQHNKVSNVALGFAEATKGDNFVLCYLN